MCLEIDIEIRFRCTGDICKLSVYGFGPDSRVTRRRIYTAISCGSDSAVPTTRTPTDKWKLQKSSRISQGCVSFGHLPNREMLPFDRIIGHYQFNYVFTDPALPRM